MTNDSETKGEISVTKRMSREMKTKDVIEQVTRDYCYTVMSIGRSSISCTVVSSRRTARD